MNLAAAAQPGGRWPADRGKKCAARLSQRGYCLCGGPMQDLPGFFQGLVGSNQPVCSHMSDGFRRDVVNSSKEYLPSLPLHATIKLEIKLEATAMSDTEPAEDNRARNLAGKLKDVLGPPSANPVAGAPGPVAEIISFDRNELREIFNLYGRKVSEGEWRDYAIDFTPQKAVFSIYRWACEYALYRIEKNPRLARKQGTYSVVTATGLILKRGQDLGRVIAALDKRLKLVSG